MGDTGVGRGGPGSCHGHHRGRDIYQADVVERVVPVPVTPSDRWAKHPGQSWVRVVQIHCTAGCREEVTFEEESFDSIISLFRLRDDACDFISIWASGSAYWVRIYHVDGATITKVMDEATKSAPEFIYSPNGSLLIRLENPDSPVSLWCWNGTRYAPKRKSK